MSIFKGSSKVAYGPDDVIPVANGGTGAQTASDALSSFGGQSAPIDLTGKTVDLNTYVYTNGYINGWVFSRSDGGTAGTTNMPKTNRAYIMWFRTPRAYAANDNVTVQTIYYSDGTVYERMLSVNASVTPGYGWIQTATNGRPLQLATARSMIVDLASATAASFSGSADVTLGIKGLLPIGNLDAKTRGMLDTPWTIVNADLNTIDGINNSVGYYLRTTADSTTTLNYPAAGLAGLLEVIGATSGNPLFQRFTSTTGRVWVRSYTGSWAAWTEIIGSGSGSAPSSTTASIAYTSGYSLYSSAFNPLTVTKTGTQVQFNGGVVGTPGGSVANMTYTKFGTIPAGYRPPADAMVPGLVYNDDTDTLIPAQIRAYANGDFSYLLAAASTITPLYIVLPSMFWLSA